MKIRIGVILLLTMFLAGFLAGCGTKVERIASDSQTDLSGNWNDTDSRLVAEEMIRDSLARPWYSNFRAGRGRIPTVIVANIDNLSHEHINTRTFIRDIERSLINSGRVSFVASSSQRKALRAERLDQDLNAVEETRKQAGRELGADFMLQGEINTILDGTGKKQVKFYQIDLTMLSLTDNRKVWLGQKKIKKLVKKKALRF